jgi:hypothetical protein
MIYSISHQTRYFVDFASPCYSTVFGSSSCLGFNAKWNYGASFPEFDVRTESSSPWPFLWFPGFDEAWDFVRQWSGAVGPGEEEMLHPRVTFGNRTNKRR